MALLVEPADLPGRLAKSELVAPSSLKRRSMQSDAGRAVLLHALAHIEFNAINLALDAIWRFPSMPAEFYLDWLKIAAEEAHHFSLLSARLKDFGHVYGDFPGARWPVGHGAAHPRRRACAHGARVAHAGGARGLEWLAGEVPIAGFKARFEAVPDWREEFIADIHRGCRAYGPL